MTFPGQTLASDLQQEQEKHPWMVWSSWRLHNSRAQEGGENGSLFLAHGVLILHRDCGYENILITLMLHYLQPLAGRTHGEPGGSGWSDAPGSSHPSQQMKRDRESVAGMGSQGGSRLPLGFTSQLFWQRASADITSTIYSTENPNSSFLHMRALKHCQPS